MTEFLPPPLMVVSPVTVKLETVTSPSPTLLAIIKLAKVPSRIPGSLKLGHVPPLKIVKVSVVAS